MVDSRLPVGPPARGEGGGGWVGLEARMHRVDFLGGDAAKIRLLLRLPLLLGGLREVVGWTAVVFSRFPFVLFKGLKGSKGSKV